MQLPSLPVFSNCIRNGLFAKPFHDKGALMMKCSAKFANVLVQNLLHSIGTVQIYKGKCYSDVCIFERDSFLLTRMKNVNHEKVQSCSLLLTINPCDSFAHRFT